MGRAAVPRRPRSRSLRPLELPAGKTVALEPGGFRWIDCDDRTHSVLAFQRMRRGAAAEDALVVALNFTPVPREMHRIGVSHGGEDAGLIVIPVYTPWGWIIIIIL